MTRNAHHFLALAALLGALALVSVAGVPSAQAAVSAPAWHITVAPTPSVLPSGVGKRGRYAVAVENVGAKTSEEGLTVRDVLPPGLSAVGVRAEPELEGPECPLAAGSEVLCRFPSGVVVPSGFVVLDIEYTVTSAVSEPLVNTVSVSGGGAPVASEQTSIPVGGEHAKAPAGVEQFAFEATGPAGEPFTQAAGHPHFLTTTLVLNSMRVESILEEFKPVIPYKNLVFYLPLGMLGDPAVTEPCPASLVTLQGERSGCPTSSRVGTILPMIVNQVFASNSNDSTNEHGIYSMVPEPGYVAEFAFAANGLTFFLYANVVRHDGAYMLRVSLPGVPGNASFIGAVTTFFGDIQEEHATPGKQPIISDRGAFLTDPSDCQASGARSASVEVDTWEAPSTMIPASALTFPTLEGCGLLDFSASLAAGPDVRVAGDTTQADEPSGYKLHVHLPQASNVGTGVGTPPFKALDFTFPEGTSLSPGAANGLTACSETGGHGIDFPSGTGLPGAPGTPAGEGEVDGPDGLPHTEQGHCPSSSIVGSVSASTPLLHESLTGHLYLAEPGCGNGTHPNPCTPEGAANGTIFRLYLELEAPERGVIVKLPGQARVDPSTGRITSVFEDTPQFPVEDLTIETSPGPRASLANPQTCGTATTTALVVPWSGGSAAEPAGSFEVNEGCGPQGFTPAFTAGTTNPAAGGYSPFTLTLKREDREQNIASLSTTLPPGLLAAVSHVTQCPEPQAAQGACPASSRVGSTTVAIGSGTQPFYQSGQVYLTGPYKGAPFGLSVVDPAVAGPFNLGNVIVRAALYINPHTTQVTAVSDPLPQIIDGVPLRIRTINVTLDAPNFTLNPTSCAPMSITGTVASTQGAQAPVSSPFQAQGCRNLPFKPILTASTKAHTSRTGGASLTVKIASTAGQANIGKVDLTLPKQLPSRNSTLQKACTQAQFNTNPAGCPEGSNIGVARAVSPLLNVPLTGPAYLVSHGGAGFPDVVFVLQGEDVRIDVTGNTNIKKGVTYSHFETVPDAPISTFETVLPQGPHSILGANISASAKGSLCSLTLNMPTTIHAQNSATIKQTTKITITGCPKTKKKHKQGARRGQGRSHSNAKRK
ncbi:MAG: hypothetical protein ACRDJ3_01200 [Solirubrobacteraceae bacterium]